MTTIAWDGRSVAADGKAVTGNGNVVTLDVVKLAHYSDCVYAVSGAHFLFEELIEWHRCGARRDAVPSADSEHPWYFLVFQGRWVNMTDNTMHGRWDKTARAPWAWGSGADLAIGAMLAGKTARQAVEIASQVDNCTGGTISEIVLEDIERAEAAE